MRKKSKKARKPRDFERDWCKADGGFVEIILSQIKPDPGPNGIDGSVKDARYLINWLTQYIAWAKEQR
jgi:hypothetical protein